VPSSLTEIQPSPRVPLPHSLVERVKLVNFIPKGVWSELPNCQITIPQMMKADILNLEERCNL